MLMHKKEGFTLIELIVVIAVFAVLAGIAVPSIQAMVNNLGSNHATVELISDLQLTRMKAIRTHRNVTVAFNTAANQYTVTWDNPPRTKTVDMNLYKGNVRLDNTPPGASPPADASFVFNAMGFITPSLGNPTGNVYLFDPNTNKRFRIQTFLPGSIEALRWDTANSNWYKQD